MTTPTPPSGPGWYDDPESPDQLRYFDGIVWTSHTTPRRSPTASSSTIGRAPEPTAPTAPAGGTVPPPTAGGWNQPQPPGQQGWGAPPPGPGQWGQQPGWGAPPPAAGWQSRRDVLPDGDVLAEWWRRLLARVIDGIVKLVVTTALSYPWLLDVFRAFNAALDEAAAGRGDTFDQTTLQNVLVGAAVPITLISLAVSVVYEVVFLTWRAATPGKMALGTRVRPVDERGPVTLVVAVRRQLVAVGGNLLSLFPVIGILGSALGVLDPAWLLWDQRRQALHDKVADTVVVLARRG